MNASTEVLEGVVESHLSSVRATRQRIDIESYIPRVYIIASETSIPLITERDISRLVYTLPAVAR